ncbi:MAG: protease [Candidatus Eisenbacteria bacterium]|nr:protease [Candidatus Eisenbacteria bacterium]
MQGTKSVAICLALAVLCSSNGSGAAHGGYYRYPALHGDTVVFAAEGDLWTVGLDGGLAERLTTHPGEESHPAISPDGGRLAFSATYEGPTEAYVMPVEGGLPRRLTYDGEWSRISGWTPDGRVLLATRKYATLPSTRLVAIDTTTLETAQIPLAQASEGDYGPNGILYFTRLAAQGSYTKRYRGGTAQDVWKFDPQAPEAVPLAADYDGTSRHPMVWDDRIYFATDRDGTMNLWSMTPAGDDLVQHTFHDGWDVKTPALSGGRIVYQLGADLRVFNITKDTDRAVPITLRSDFDQLRETWIEEPMDYLTAAHIAPGGEAVVLTARGEVFVAPASEGRFVEASRSPGVRYRHARFLPPDGESLVVLSDETGEVEWWRLSRTGTEPPERITSGGDVLRYDGIPSPDGRWIVSYDRNQEMHLIEVSSGRSREIDFAPQWGYDEPRWSPDSRYFIYARQAHNTFQQIRLYDVRAEETLILTSDRYESYDARWSPDGEWIYFLSDRRFHSIVPSPWGRRQPEPYFDKQTQIYLLALRDGRRSPFDPATELDPRETDEEEDDEDVDGAPPDVRIDRDGLRERLHLAPAPPGNYTELSVAEDRLFWLSSEAGERGRHDLMMMKITSRDPEPQVLAEEVKSYQLSLDREHLLIRRGDALFVIDAVSSAPADLDDGRIDLSHWRFPMQPAEEWRQIFVESWRLMRDYFYDPGMHGVDWDAILAKYLPLVERVTSRSELDDLMGQMGGELSALHVYIRKGDEREGPEDISMGSLGAVLQRDPDAGGYRIRHIYRADPEQPSELSPLARPGVGVAAGDVIRAINGVPVLEAPHPGALLRNQAGRQVRLSILPGGRGQARDLIVIPMPAGGEYDLRYDEWELTRRELVDSLSAGRIGYVHLRAMGTANIAEWYRDFYPVFDRRGLIIDVRHNGGGNIDSWILEKLQRRAWMYWAERIGDTSWNMQYAFRGHMAVLADEWTASDGEAFAEGFRRLGLGKVIGTRTWGGEIWLSFSNRLVDKGILSAPESGVYGPEGEWLIEQHGVDPDIMVDNLPHATFQGEDAQLVTAIRHLEKLIREEPRPVPEPPPYPAIEMNGEEGRD